MTARLHERKQAGGHDNQSMVANAWDLVGTSPCLLALPTPRQGRSLKRKNKARELTRPTHAADNRICICGYNHVTFNVNMRVVVFDFVDYLSWRRGLCAEKPRRGTAIEKK